MKLKTLVSILLLIVIMTFFYMGHYYQTLGDQVGSITMTLIIFVLMGLLLWGATAARQREGSFSTVLHIVGIVLGILYFIVGALFVVPKSSHFFYVNGEKQNIQAQADTVIERTNEMLAVYKKMVDNRSLRLKRDIINSQKTPAGKAEFAKAYPNKAYNIGMDSIEKKNFGESLLRAYHEIKVEWENQFRPEFSSKLAHDWSAFDSPGNSLLLANKVSEYSYNLQDAYQKYHSPFEKLRGEQPVFEKEVTAGYIVDEFESNETSVVWNIVLLILVILSASSFIFVQGTHVKTQKKKDPILETGQNL